MTSHVALEVYRGKRRRDGKPALFYYRARARNGRVLYDSQGYTRRWSAKRAAWNAYPGAPVEDLSKPPGSRNRMALPNNAR